MPRATPIWNSFAGGELSPLLGGRTDLQKYFTGAAVMENFIALPQGPATRRPGTVYAGATRRGARTRLVPFIFGARDAYMLEFTHRTMRVWRDRALVLDATGHPYELALPYGEDDLDGLDVAQTADLLYLVHPRHPPRRLLRYAHALWALQPVEFQDGPYLEPVLLPAELTPSGTSGTIVLTASQDIFKPGHVGALYRLNHSVGEGDEAKSVWGWVKLLAYIGPREVQAEIKGTLGAPAATTTWREGAWSTERGFPAAITFHEQRLWLGGSPFKPQTLWASRSGRFEEFGVAEPLADDDALTYTFAASQVNVIQWLRSGRTLMVGTSGGEWSVTGATPTAGLTPSSVAIRQQSTLGSAPVAPIQVGGSVMFVQRGGTRLRVLAYSFQDDGFSSPDLTLQAEHVAKPEGIAQLAYQAMPNAILWAVTRNGRLIGLTYERDQEVAGFHRHPMPAGFVEALATIPTPDGTEDDVWMVVRRPAADGNIQRCVEILRGADADPPMADCSLSLASAQPVGHLGGLDHLDGMTVAIAADGGAHRPVSVIDGTITLDAPARSVTVGLPYVSRLVSMRIEAGAADGTAQTRMKNISKLGVRFLRTVGGRFGPAGGPLDPVPTQRSATPLGLPPPPFDGDVELTLSGSYNRSGQVEILQDQPLPITVLAFVSTVTVND